MSSRHARQPPPVLRRVRGAAAALVASVVVALLAPAPGAGAPPPRRIVYAGDRDFPPYEFLDSAGRPSGLNVELIRAVAKAQGLEVEILLEPWVQVRKDLASGAADVAAMYRTEHRVREVDFAIPHEVVYHEMFVRAGAAPLTGVGDLTGKKVLYQGGSYPEDALAALSCRCTPIPAATERGALEALARGEGDVAVVSQAMRRPFVDRKELGRAVVQTGPPILVAEYAFVTAKGREPLVETLNLGLAAV
ncbi:MAG TPA: transporter substrate-binding domain-containing protein, partial [Anaeromyxobacteraceae bacterium]|nr:transporter substrate-binding domain-containing protein [Anaeromyxobacteraceae bacterium]